MSGRAPSGASAAIGRWRRSWQAPALVFFASGAVLVLEILAGRLVAPYVGVSLETYTGIIGTVLAGIAVGSATGGRIADRHDPRPLLGPLLVASGAATLLVLPVVASLGPGVAEAGGGPGGIVLLAVTAFVLPTALLSAVTPMVAKLRLDTTAETGAVVGGLAAAGTAGALVGTFATGFVFVAAWPTRPIMVVVALTLIAAGLAVSFRLRRRPPPVPTAVALLVLLGAGGAAQALPSPCDEETRYYCASIRDDAARRSGRTLVLDNLRHSYVDLADPTHLEFRYTRAFAAVVDRVFARGDPLDALHVGGGGFTMPRWLAATRPGSVSTVLELDPAVVALGRRELGVGGIPALNVRTGDARVAIREQPSDAYDLVVGDAFGGLAVPWHLTTVEMIREVERVLRADGAYVLNVIDAGRRRLVRAELASLALVFDHVAFIAPPGGGNGNHVLVASDRGLDLADVFADDGVVVRGDDVTRFVDGAAPLRDDYAPADQLLTRR